MYPHTKEDQVLGQALSATKNIEILKLFTVKSSKAILDRIKFEVEYFKFTILFYQLVLQLSIAMLISLLLSIIIGSLVQ